MFAFSVINSQLCASTINIMTTARKPMKFGYDFTSVPDLVSCIQQLTDWGYSYACIPLVQAKLTPDQSIDGSKTLDRSALVNRADVILQAETWNRVVIKLSPDLNLDTPDIIERERNAVLFKQEVSYGSYLNVSAIMFNLPLTSCIPNLARIVNITLYDNMFINFFIRVPMSTTNNTIDTWKLWSAFSTACDYHKSVYLALELSTDLPDQQELNRWLGEPIKAVIMHTSIFLTNKVGHPVLSRPHQMFVNKLLDLDACIFISGESTQNVKPYFEYLSFIHENNKFNKLYSYSYAYEDLLQVPLQPLINDLDNNVYAVFEQDPIKYQQYEKAITKALSDKAKGGNTDVLIICVVGAGRGPLVNASLKASDNANVPVKVYAVEKNENALLVLNYNNDNYWHNMVTVVGADMRTWKFEEKCDILVSELLGSFGDNELSPECLDGAQQFLKDDGICIPSSYTSYISPLQSQTLFSNMKMFKSTLTTDNNLQENAEQIYVVNMRNMYIIAHAQPLFTFEHPRCDMEKNNDRYSTLTFDIKQDCILHGFAGYFNAVLYKDINISIEPSTFSTGMFSWYPAYIPIKNSMILKKDDKLMVHFWRLSNTSKVWYEWSISEPNAISIHNPNARSYSMHLH